MNEQMDGIQQVVLPPPPPRSKSEMERDAFRVNVVPLMLRIKILAEVTALLSVISTAGLIHCGRLRAWVPPHA